VSGDVIQYGRRVRITLDAGGRSVLVTDSEPDEDRGLRATFRVERHLKLEPVRASCTLWGMAKERREDLTRICDEALETAWRTRTARKVGRVRIEAGRPGAFGQLFVGEIQEVKHERDGATWRTDLTALDGRLEWEEARVSESIAPGIDLSTLQDVLKASEDVILGKQPFDAFAERFQELAAVKGVSGYEQGFALMGPSRDVNASITDLLGADMWWVDGEQKLLPKGRTLSDPAIVLVRGETLLSETRVARGYSDALTWLDPRFAVGLQVQLREKDGRPIRALAHRVEAATFDASTWERAWYARLRLRPSALDSGAAQPVSFAGALEAVLEGT
jgi:hypothetical protein